MMIFLLVLVCCIILYQIIQSARRRDDRRPPAAISGPRATYSQRELGELSKCIATGLRYSRQEWFGLNVQLLRQHKTSNGTTPFKDVVNAYFGGKAEVAIKAYQVHCAYSFLEKYHYVSNEQRKEFDALLLSRICDNHLDVCVSYLPTFVKGNADRGRPFFTFLKDVAEYITRSKMPLAETLVLSRTLLQFTTINYIVIAGCFGDEATVVRLRREAKGTQC